MRTSTFLSSCLVLLTTAFVGACNGAASPSTSSSCEELARCCSANPLGAADECRTTAASNDTVECGYFLEDARAEGECMAGSTDAGGGGGTDAGPACFPDGWQGCDDEYRPCCHGSCTRQ